MKQALLAIDVQNDYFPNGKMELYQPLMALAKITQLEKHFIQKNLPIIYIQHVKHKQNANFFEANTSGAELHSQLNITSDSIIIEKHFPNSFYRTNLETTLHNLGIEQLVICGMMTHMCVDSTTRASRELHFDPIVIHDATATKNLRFGQETVPAEEVQISFLASLTNFATITLLISFPDNPKRLQHYF